MTTTAPSTDGTPGWYCYGPVPRLAEWDGTAWTGDSHGAAAAPVLAGPPRPFAFLLQPWVRWIVLGQALVILPALLSGGTGVAWWSLVSVVGYAAFLGGSVLVVTRYLALDRLGGMRALTWIGIGSGVVAFGIGFGLEVIASHLFGWASTLWLAGPIEEGGKLFVPVLLLVFGAPRFRIPKVGLYLVLVSSATVGVIEGVEYQVRPEFAWAHLEMALIRPSAELLHVFVAGFAAAVIWLAAWRRGRVVTGAGVVAFLVAAGIHSFHDGIATFGHVDPKAFNASLAQTLGEALAKGTAGALFAAVIAAFCFLLARHGARELTGPEQIAGCPSPWRPQVKSWGCDHPVATDLLAAAPWNPYVQPGYAPGYGQPGYAPGYGQPGYAPGSVQPGSAPGSGPPGYAPPVSAPPAPASAPIPPVPVPAVAGPGVGPSWSPAPPPFPPLPPVPVPAGWYPQGGDPGRIGWWDGSSWTSSLAWNGYDWQQQ